MRLPLHLASDDGRTIKLATCHNCGRVKILSDPCGFDHFAAILDYREALS